ncbi:MAG: isocitrate lyase/PEP mutase family protein [Betaproteobacteria bacterium]|nr:MAG: isocitrate lyase/PEP mutase family protein [Betaproteobacteria bacterium]
MTKGQLLHDALGKERPLLAIGAFDAFTARMAAPAEFHAVYLGSFAAAASMCGLPDFGLLSATEMADHMRRLTSATHLPCIADADTGYGNALNVQRTVRLYEAAGVAAMHIEDQITPKKCGHIAGKQVIPAAEMVQKIRAAVAARQDPAFTIIARTDARAVTGLDDAIARCRAYADAGADALFVDAPETVEEVARVGRELASTGKKLVFNAARTGKTPPLKASRVGELGFHIMIFPIEPLLAAYPVMKEVMAVIRRDGSPEAMADRLAQFAEINDVVGLKDYYHAEREFIVR